MDFGARIKQLRNSKELKQSDLAEILGCSSSAIGSYERCERQPSFELLQKYANYFKVSMDYILCNSNETETIEQYQTRTTLELLEIFDKFSMTLDGVPLTEIDKQRILDIATVLLFDRLK